MMKDSLQVLEYDQLLKIISTYAESKVGKEYLLSLKPISDHDEIDERLRLLGEIREFINVKGKLSIGELLPVDEILNKSSIEGLHLLPEELLLIKKLVETAVNIKKFIISEGKEYKRLYKIAQHIPDLKDLLSILDKSISDTGRLKDSASPRLKKIRDKKAYYRVYVQKKLEQTLSTQGIKEFQLSIRDGRYVAGISSSKKTGIKGIFHGYSHSKATSFIEPAEIVEENNKIAELEAEEREEEKKILAFLTNKVAQKGKEIKEAQNILAKIDALSAQAKFCDLLRCVMPEISNSDDEDIIDIRGARNPLLAYFYLNEKKDCVPTDILLTKEKKVLIISGPNRGGKTVALKTLGLLVLMTQTGIHIPAQEGSKLRIFKKIIAEIGDEQNIRSGMSTFSAHVQHLKEIIDQADKDSLIIIDEPGMGTDPMEGAGLSMAILDYLIEKGSFVAISTHLNKIKLYGLQNPKIMNASVEFDIEKKLPTYRLKYGSPGVSMGFEIAKEMGIPDHILNRAKAYVDENEYKLNKSIETFSNIINELENEKREFQRLKHKYQMLSEEINREKEKIINSAKEEVDSIILEAKQKAIQILEDIKKENRNVSPKQIISKFSDITQNLSSKLGLKAEPESKNTFEPKEGQLVYHKGLKNKAVVSQYKPDKKKALISMGNIRLWVDLKDLEPIASKENDKKELADQEDQDKVYEGTYMPEINIVGHRVEEAIRTVDKAINEAILKGSPGIRIIHGIGTGRLKKAVREYLKNISHVIKEIRSGEAKIGGDGITVVEFK